MTRTDLLFPLRSTKGNKSLFSCACFGSSGSLSQTSSPRIACHCLNGLSQELQMC